MEASIKAQREDIKKLLELPGMCPSDEQEELIDLVNNIPEKELADVVVSLRLRSKQLLRLAESNESRQAILETKKHLEVLAQKYGIST